MCGAAKTITRGVTAGLTGGLSEFTHGKDAFGVEHMTNALGLTHSSLSNAPAMAGGNQNPAQILSQTGGAPLLASISMGADVKGTIASYFGASDYDAFFKSLNPQDQELITGIHNQLSSIQSNAEMKNTALKNIVSDFPNIAVQAANTHLAAGGEFDQVTKDYMDKALGASAAKYAAGGGLSSGAMAEAAARTGADLGMQKLSYQDQRADQTYGQGVQGWQAKYNEANALRTFQQGMTNLAIDRGFKGSQNALDRNMQTNLFNAKSANDLNMANQQDRSAMFGAIGSIGSSIIHGQMMNNSQPRLFGTHTELPVDTFQTDSFNKNNLA